MFVQQQHKVRFQDHKVAVAKIEEEEGALEEKPRKTPPPSCQAGDTEVVKVERPEP